jgi:hypothetical protein
MVALDLRSAIKEERRRRFAALQVEVQERENDDDADAILRGNLRRSEGPLPSYAIGNTHVEVGCGMWTLWAFL